MKKYGALYILLLLVCLGFLLYNEVKPFVTSYFVYKRSNSTPFIQITYPETQSEKYIQSVEISQIPLDQLKNFANNNYNSPTFEQDGDKYEIVYQGKEITHLQLSPDQKSIGFYVDTPKENTVFGRVSLVIMDFEERNFREISEAERRVSNWEWRDNSSVAIHLDCGTSCHYVHVRSIKDSELIAEYLDE